MHSSMVGSPAAVSKTVFVGKTDFNLSHHNIAVIKGFTLNETLKP